MSSEWTEEPFETVHVQFSLMYVCFFLLPRCMECSRSIAMGILSVHLSVRLSVRPSVYLSNACIVTKRKKTQSIFLYHAIDNLV